MNAKQYDEAILQYTMALSLVPTRPQDLLVKRSKAFAAAGIWKDALNDANEVAHFQFLEFMVFMGTSQVIKLDPSSPLGYERKHHAIRGARRDSDATAAFEMMLLKMSESPDPEIRGEGSPHYTDMFTLIYSHRAISTLCSTRSNARNDSFRYKGCRSWFPASSHQHQFWPALQQVRTDFYIRIDPYLHGSRLLHDHADRSCSD